MYVEGQDTPADHLYDEGQKEWYSLMLQAQGADRPFIEGYCVHALYVYFCVGYYGELTMLWPIVMDLNVSGTSEDRGELKV